MNYSPTVLRQRRSFENPFIEVSDSIRTLIRFGLAIFIAYTWILGLLSDQVAPYHAIRLPLTTIYILVVTIPLWMKLPGIGLVHPLFLISALHFLQGTLSGIRGSVLGLEAHPALPGMGSSQIAFLQLQITGLLLLSKLSLYFGYFSTPGISWKSIQFRERGQILVTASVLCTIIGLVSLYLLMDLSGGVFAHLKNINIGVRHRTWAKDPTNAPIYGNLVKLLVVPPAVMVLDNKSATRNPLFWVLAVIGAASGFMIAGRRTQFVLNVLTIAACWVVKQRKISIGRLTGIWLLVFFAVGILGNFRRSNWRGRDVNFSAFTEVDIATAFEASLVEIEGRRLASPLYPIVARVPSDVPYKYGMNYVAYLNRFIPRRFWPDKPRGIGLECAEVFYGRVNSGGIPPGRIGEAYWSGGFAVVAIVFFIWGRLLKSFGNFFVRFRDSTIATLLYLATITQFGPSEPQFRIWLYLIVPTVGLLVVLGILATSPGRGAAAVRN